MRATKILPVLLCLTLTACQREAKAQVNECDMDAEKTYAARPDPDNDANYLDKMSFIVTCMRSHHYEIDFKRPNCDGKTPPSPQTRAECYRYDWWGTSDSN